MNRSKSVLLSSLATVIVFSFLRNSVIAAINPIIDPTDIIIPTIVIPTIVIPTFVTPTPGNGNESNGNIDLCALRGCPTATPTPTAKPQLTTTPTNGPTPTDTPSSGGIGGASGSSSGSSSSSSPSSQGQVLGTNTMAATGAFADTVVNLVALSGILSLAAAATRYAKEKN